MACTHIYIINQEKEYKRKQAIIPTTQKLQGELKDNESDKKKRKPENILQLEESKTLSSMLSQQNFD